MDRVIFPSTRPRIAQIAGIKEEPITLDRAQK
jgi:hypothetical protein